MQHGCSNSGFSGAVQHPHRQSIQLVISNTVLKAPKEPKIPHLGSQEGNHVLPQLLLGALDVLEDRGQRLCRETQRRGGEARV